MNLGRDVITRRKVEASTTLSRQTDSPALLYSSANIGTAREASLHSTNVLI